MMTQIIEGTLLLEERHQIHILKLDRFHTLTDKRKQVLSCQGWGKSPENVGDLAGPGWCGGRHLPCEDFYLQEGRSERRKQSGSTVRLAAQAIGSAAVEN